MTTAVKKLSISDVLQALLSQKKISASELARLAHIPQPTIHRITNGTHTKPHFKTLSTLANYFGISINQLRGLEPLPHCGPKPPSTVSYVPIIRLQEALVWPHANYQDYPTTVIDLETTTQPFAVYMPDASMEPLIPSGALLIVDPKRTPQHHSMVVIKAKNKTDVLIRQLIIDAKNCYIKPLSQDFDHPEWLSLEEPEDSILGVVVEVRLHCEKKTERK